MTIKSENVQKDKIKRTGITKRNKKVEEKNRKDKNRK